MKKSTRWATAAAVPVAVVAASIVVPAVSATADVDLPDKTPQQVLALAASSSEASYSGTIEQTSDLGLPDVSAQATGGGSSSDAAGALDLLTGSHTAKVYADGATKQRVQVIDDLAERNVIRDGSSVWTYDSKTKDATHATLPDRGATEKPSALPDGTTVPQTPAELADLVLSSIEPTTTVTADSDVRVAGRDAYQVVLTPKDSSTLVASATLTVDAETGIPLKVVVAAKGQSDPALSAGFTSVDFGAPAASVFAFTPPADATVTDVTVPTGASGRSEGDAAHAEKTVIGSGWSTIVGVTPAAGSTDGTSSADADSTGLLDQLTTKVDGGRVLETSLVSVLLTDDGRVFAGAVDASTLQAAVAGQ
ncbi:sigma-E factor regulatory protein RseB domain-containing protein [Frigoribacterium sp. PhB24]|uniref:LolA family protein n=1 Tax=Frigoribacterium sp. PhB24 TaxID=2485204 RepID=UPI000F46B4FB|nr:sigma-E factor regulatory protein RseB domain-containing protein [Frigoribacterium sp. PhB24]ROS51538.1 outer membrane lipoprotein-sorting protein [Frigoribacterium sp. PhB24]